MQALDDCIKEIRDDPNISTWNEAQAKEWIIRPILDSLSWGRREIIPEYGVETLWVDYALLINGENKVFIEAKRPSEKLETHQKQLLDYSFGEGVALAILTNGIAWWFYLPLKEGAWNNRKFYTIDILEQEIEDIVDKFSLLLSRENVASGEAVRQAESILKSRQREKIVEARLPEAWNRVIDSPDSLLVDLLAETAAEMGDFRPTDDEILRFISSHRNKWSVEPSQTQTTNEMEREVPPSTKPTVTTTKPQTKNQTERPKRMQIDSESYDLGPGYKILVNTANWLIDKDVLKVSDRIKLSRQGSENGRLNLFEDKIQNGRTRDWTDLKNGLYIYKNLKIEDSIKNARRLLEKYGYDPEILKIDY